MGSVTLYKGNDVIVVSTPREYVAAVYGEGYLPQIGTIEDNAEIISPDGPSVPPESWPRVLESQLPERLSDATLRSTFALRGSAGGEVSSAELQDHIDDPTPHPAYDDLPDLVVLFENGLV